MKIGVLGTGMVGQTIGSKLVEEGHDVMMGSRTRGNERAVAWTAAAGERASHGTFADAAAFGEVLINCTAGTGSLAALGSVDREDLRGKILIDIANPLDFSHGMPPTLTISNTDSLGERIQADFPELRVVKTLNTLNTSIMVDPTLVPGDHTVFVSGDDAAAKAQVTQWLVEWFGWKRENIIDLGDISTARGTEMVLPLWIRLMLVLGHPNFNFHVVVGPKPQG